MQRHGVEPAYDGDTWEGDDIQGPTLGEHIQQKQYDAYLRHQRAEQKSRRHEAKLSGEWDDELTDDENDARLFSRPAA